MLLTIRAHPSYPCQSVFSSGSPMQSAPVRNATSLVRAEALPERVEAPAGLACRLSWPLPEGPGLIQPAGRARPQPGLQPAGGARYPAALPTSGLRRRGCSLPSVLIRHIRANPCSLPALRCRARLRGTRTPTVTISTRLSAIDYRLLAIGYRTGYGVLRASTSRTSSIPRTS